MLTLVATTAIPKPTPESTPQQPLARPPPRKNPSLNARRPLKPLPPPSNEKAVDIEKLLQWAYRDELSKRVTSSAEGLWDQIQGYGQRGGVDVDTGHGAAQRYAHFGLPHPDSETIEKAVAALPDTIVDWAASRDAVMGELAPLLSNRDVLLIRPFRTEALVTMHASMGTRPGWHTEPPRPVPVISLDGKRPSIVGECRGRNLYASGSYCPLRYEPSPLSIAMDRLDYAAWHRGLCILVDVLRLERHKATMPSAPPRPWFSDEAPHTIFVVGERRMPTLPLHPQRKIPNASPARRRFGPARKIPIDTGGRMDIRHIIPKKVNDAS